MILLLSPCPTGWDFEPARSLEVGKLAVETGVWPLKEYVDGEVVHTRRPKEHVPAERYLEVQGRFAHLFSPQRDEAELARIQARVDAYWDAVS
jgi:pyruvate ferredoxin oxidoreductase beta subunit